MDRGLFAIVLIQFLAIGGLLWLVRLVDRSAHRRSEEIADRVAFVGQQCREALAAYKLEVAKSYASVGLIKDVERRLTEHLARIESKLQQGGK